MNSEVKPKDIIEKYVEGIDRLSFSVNDDDLCFAI